MYRFLSLSCEISGIISYVPVAFVLSAGDVHVKPLFVEYVVKTSAWNGVCPELGRFRLKASQSVPSRSCIRDGSSSPKLVWPLTVRIVSAVQPTPSRLVL